jgi:uncharacterized protein (DUF2147 family)
LVRWDRHTGNDDNTNEMTTIRTGQVARIRCEQNALCVCWRKTRDDKANGRSGSRVMILKLTFREEEARKWTGIIWLEIETRSKL